MKDTPVLNDLVDAITNQKPRYGFLGHGSLQGAKVILPANSKGNDTKMDISFNFVNDIGLYLLDDSNDDPIGFFEFKGPRAVTTYAHDSYDPGFDTYFMGFECTFQGWLSRALSIDTRANFEVSEQYRKSTSGYSGFGKALLSVGIECMKEIMHREHPKYISEDSPLLMVQQAMSPIFVKHYGGRLATNYMGVPNDVVVFADAKCPEINIGKDE